MNRQLSSNWTPFFKIVVPTIWIGGLGTATVFLFIYPDALGNPDAIGIRWILLIILLVGILLFYWSCMRMKEVSLAHDTLIISNYLKEIRVPLREIERVSASILMSILTWYEPVWIYFRHPTAFGKRVVFIPQVRLSGGFSKHPIVDELRELIAAANRGESQ